MEMQKCKKFVYKVARGEGVLDIATKFGISPHRLIKENNLIKEVFFGQLLLIDCTKNSHVVEIGTTAADIILKTNKSLPRLLEENGADYLYFGMILDF